MSTKKINAGDTLTVGDLTDDHLGAVIEVGPVRGITYRFEIASIERRESGMVAMWTAEKGVQCAYLDTTGKIITPPPVVQPDKPTILGQCIRIEGDDDWLGMVVDPQEGIGLLWDTDGYWRHWDYVLRRAGDRRIIVSDSPRWPDETPDVPERIEVGEWPDDDKHLREWEWIGHLGYRWRWYAEATRKTGWAWTPDAVRRLKPIRGPWTRGERVK